VDEAELALRRSQMGRSCIHFVANGPGSLGDQAPGFWVALSGAASPDLNVALVDSGDPEVIAHAVGLVEKAGFPAFILQAGHGLETDLGPSWQQVGEMPFMAFDLDANDPLADNRVRRVLPSEREVFDVLLADAFGLELEVADVVGALLERGDPAGNAWFLLEGELPVSTVLAATVDDAACVWCMATPKRFARRGYGRALLSEVLRRAKTSGAHVALLGATAAGKPLYDATGWKTLELWRVSTNLTAEHTAG
jgi:GNAT superfamily N-acetyltransferase